MLCQLSQAAAKDDAGEGFEAGKPLLQIVGGFVNERRFLCHMCVEFIVPLSPEGR